MKWTVRSYASMDHVRPPPRDARRGKCEMVGSTLCGQSRLGERTGTVDPQRTVAAVTSRW